VRLQCAEDSFEVVDELGEAGVGECGDDCGVGERELQGVVGGGGEADEDSVRG
jgi:hypothetical protein